VRLTGALVSCRGAVAGEHRPAPPAGQAHEIALVAARGEPLMGIGVTEAVRVDVGDSGRSTAAPDNVRM
jgi:hypothetical protein